MVRFGLNEIYLPYSIRRLAGRDSKSWAGHCSHCDVNIATDAKHSVGTAAK